MTSTLLIVQFGLAIVITISILLQKSSSMGLGAYSGSNDSMFGSKGPANFLTKLTFTFGFLFVLNTLALGYLYNQKKESSVVDNVELKTLSSESNISIPVAPTVPTRK